MSHCIEGTRVIYRQNEAEKKKQASFYRTCHFSQPSSKNKKKKITSYLYCMHLRHRYLFSSSRIFFWMDRWFLSRLEEHTEEEIGNWPARFFSCLLSKEKCKWWLDILWSCFDFSSELRHVDGRRGRKRTSSVYFHTICFSR